MVDYDSLSNESGAVGPGDWEASPAADSLPSAWKHHRRRFHLQWKEVGAKVWDTNFDSGRLIGYEKGLVDCPIEDYNLAWCVPVRLNFRSYRGTQQIIKSYR